MIASQKPRTFGAQPTRRRQPLFLLVALLLTGTGLLLTVGIASAVDVGGSLRVPDNLAAPEATEGPKTHYWKVWNGFIDPRPARVDKTRDLTVVLTGPGGDAPAGCNYSLSGGDFAPSAMVAKPGGDLRIENGDGCGHELYSDDLEGFAPLQTAPGNARVIRLPGSGGPFAIRDRIYPHTRGWVHVLPDLVACGSIASNGRYSFSGVRAGTYTLKVFYQGSELASQEVEIPDEREHTIAPLSLEAPAR